MKAKSVEGLPSAKPTNNTKNGDGDDDGEIGRERSELSDESVERGYCPRIARMGREWGKNGEGEGI